jgi:hypothetical protein
MAPGCSKVTPTCRAPLSAARYARSRWARGVPTCSRTRIARTDGTRPAASSAVNAGPAHDDVDVVPADDVVAIAGMPLFTLVTEPGRVALIRAAATPERVLVRLGGTDRQELARTAPDRQARVPARDLHGRDGPCPGVTLRSVPTHR